MIVLQRYDCDHVLWNSGNECMKNCMDYEVEGVYLELLLHSLDWTRCCMLIMWVKMSVTGSLELP